MTIMNIFFSFFLVLHFFVQRSITSSVVTGNQVSVLSTFISKMTSAFFTQHRMFIAFGGFAKKNVSHLDDWIWTDKFAEVTSMQEIISSSGGIINVKLNSYQTHFIPIERHSKSWSEMTQLVLLILPHGIPSSADENILLKRLNLPLLNPPTVKNSDKYVIITEKSRIKTLYKYNFFRKLKWKLVLTGNPSTQLTLHQFCLHCPIKEKTFQHSILKFSVISDYFPDFQRNYYGYVLKATATDKMYGDLEFAKDPVTGEDYAKRGIFAIVLRHLSEGLNFTGTVFRSSGGGSTGTPFPNGSWVGSVGDVYYGDATFCMLCSISLSRHRVIDMCSPVTYEYVKFAIGPTAKIYTWQSLFWPFDWLLWLTMLLTTGVIILCSYLFMKYNVENRESNHQSINSWDIYGVTQFYGRIFIEQSDELPITLPQPIRIIIGFWLLFALVGTTIYRAKMVTFMTFPVFERAPQTFDELVASDYKIEFHYFPNIAYNSFRMSSNPVMQLTFHKLIKEPDPVKCMMHTLASKSVCIMFTSVHEDTINRNVSDMFGQSPIKAAPGYAYLFSPGIVLEKMSDVYSNFKWILSNSLQMGLNEHWQRSDAFLLLQHRNSWVKSLPPNADRSGVFQHNKGNSDDILHLKHLKGAYVILFSGVISATVAFAFEMLKTLKIKMKKLMDRLVGGRARKADQSFPAKTIEIHCKSELIDVDERGTYASIF